MRGVGGLLLAAALAAQTVSRQAPEVITVGVRYGQADERLWRSDIVAIRALGFNGVTRPLSWASAEPARGSYQLDRARRFFDRAGESGLRVLLQLETSRPPAWLFERYPDGRHVPEGATASDDRYCFDHPGVRADLLAFIGAVSERAASSPPFQAIDVESGTRPGFCVCSYSTARFNDWRRGRYGANAPPATEAAAVQARFLAEARRDDLALKVAAAKPRGQRPALAHAETPATNAPPPAPDDWLMAGVVDRYGTALAGASDPAARALAMDNIRGAAGDKGWQLAVPASPPDRVDDLRLLAWSALARGARTLTLADWSAIAAPAAATAPAAVSHAGAFAGIVARNPALFAPLRPRQAGVAVVVDPSAPNPYAAAARFHKAMSDWNLPVDFLSVADLVAGNAVAYRALFVDQPASLGPAAAPALTAYASQGGAIVSDAAALPAALAVPEVKIAYESGPAGSVETRYLESADVIMLVGVNHADAPQRVTLTFAPNTQEAIWQNMETGSSVNFVAGPQGPVYTYRFEPRGVLVLMIRRTLR